MIVGRSICKLFDGMTINVGGNSVTVQNNMGNQDALDKFIDLSNKKNKQKYPLIFYVTNKIYQEDKNWKWVETDLIIMMNTNQDLLYKERTDKVYIPYIDPIYKQIKNILNAESQIQVIGGALNERYQYIDHANYGITEGNPSESSSKKSVVTDYVDARIIKINFRINTECI